MKSIGALVLVATLLAFGCSDDATITAPSTTTTSPVTETFTSIVSPLGTNTHSFNAKQAGAINVTLTAADPSIVMGLGLGIPNPVASGCSLTTSVNTPPGSTPQISTSADTGSYCVAIFDVGNAPSKGVSFSISIVHP